MKTITQSYGLICLILLTSGCKEKSSTIPDLISMPEVNYIYKITNNDTSKNINIFIDAFYVSNEITNKQYRDFTDWVKNHPEETLFKVKDIVTRKYPELGKRLVYTIPWPIKASDLLPTLIDSNALYKLDKRFKNYFTNPKFDDYPVVGVSSNAAEYYCHWLWRIQSETKIIFIKEKGRIFPRKYTISKNTTENYRLPSDLEWEYISNHPYKRKFQNDNRLHKTTEGTTNRWGIFHINDNVSEWASSPDDTLALSRGGNWFEKDIAIDRYRIHPDSSNGFTGFRVVLNYKPEIKKEENK